MAQLVADQQAGSATKVLISTLEEAVRVAERLEQVAGDYFRGRAVEHDRRRDAAARGRIAAIGRRKRVRRKRL